MGRNRFASIRRSLSSYFFPSDFQTSEAFARGPTSPTEGKLARSTSRKSNKLGCLAISSSNPDRDDEDERPTTVQSVTSPAPTRASHRSQPSQSSQFTQDSEGGLKRRASYVPRYAAKSFADTTTPLDVKDPAGAPIRRAESLRRSASTRSRPADHERRIQEWEEKRAERRRTYIGDLVLPEHDEGIEMRPAGVI